MKYKALIAAVLVTAATVLAPISGADASDGSYSMNVSVNLGGERKAISPYIYGINQYGNQNSYDQVTATAIRQGGNRMTAYNWETNASNAGSDWKNSSDNNLSNSERPADCVQVLSKEAAKNNINYKMTTLQMAGYVSADKNGSVSASEAAPSDRWNKVEFRKSGALSMDPDLTDGTVYMDEYINYIVNTLGNSQSATGIQGYSLDNEPALWHHTHSLIHPEEVSMKELHEKSIELASIVKEIDPGAEVFGPALYGYTAYDHLADDDASEWGQIQSQNGYNWYIDYYLDTMKQAEEECGTRLLDVLDIHYYSESARVGTEDRLQSVRTLYEEGFVENSWIGQWCQQNLPLLPTVQESIDKYYPGTKLAISEYNFGGGDEISGTIAQAEALGCYADAGVYFATMWGNDCPYIYSGINLYTNYDGKGGCFGDTLVDTQTDDVSLASSYSAINGTDDSIVTTMLTNKSMTEAQDTVITFSNTDTEYRSAAVYAVCNGSSDIQLLDVIDDVKDNQVTVTLPALSAAMIVTTDDASDFEGLTPGQDQDPQQREVIFEDIASMTNADGEIVIPIDDAENLEEIEFTANVSSSAGSSWATVGCALSINAADENGEVFWTSKTFNMTLGNDVQNSVRFDGTFTKDEEDINAVISDGKVIVQRWWEASEKLDNGETDNVSCNYTKIRVLYKETSQMAYAVGDINMDGSITIADAVLLQKFLLTGVGITQDQFSYADCTCDTKLNAMDLARLRNILLG